MFGLSVRWSLVDTDQDTLDRLRDYVADDSYARFETLEGLRWKTWRARDGEWFEGTYVFESADARDSFRAEFESRAAGAPGSLLIGAPPELIESWGVIAVAEGPAGFAAASRVGD